MMNTVNVFSKSNGLIVNPLKCKLFCGSINDEAKEAVKQLTNFEQGQLPVKYLGVPLTNKRLTINHYLPLIEKRVERIRHWTSRLLSYAGRVQLIQSVAFAIAQYLLQCLPLPKFVLNKIDCICRTFLWTGNSVMDDMKSSTWSWVFLNIMKQRQYIPQLQQLWDKMVSNDKFSMKLVFECLVGSMAKVDWRYLMRHNPARPRAMIILWMLCHGRLSTKDRMCRFGFIQDNACSLCRENDETMPHLFFSCRITHTIWSHILKWIECHHTPCAWQDELKWVTATTRKKGWKARLLKLAFTETVYGIWHLRNSMIFDTLDRSNK
ncbi:uncharacterized protein LOC131657902 [Vicia villosa]|uniref:uncharacterized protein LOC131657902 n=1 Tax=Vicia villosa TaxID=3911 RepID=UPI00273C531C|nr:uncharacterized protein LOC131657902 [Vicia villosa]